MEPESRKSNEMTCGKCKEARNHLNRSWCSSVCQIAAEDLMRVSLGFACAVLLLASAARAQQTTGFPATAPRPAPNVTAASRTQPNRLPIERQPGPGVIMGYVYWDASTIKHSPLNSCDGLSVRVDLGNETLGTFSAGHFSYIAGVGTLGVCAYAVNQMPVEQNLQVLINVTTAAAFSPAALPGGGAASINIMGGTDACNNLPPAVPSPADLSRHWWTCPNDVYNLNFVLVRAPGSLSSPVAGPVRVAPGAAVELSPKADAPNNGTLLASGAQKTLLGDGSVRPATGNMLEPSQAVSAQGSPGSNPGSASIPSKGNGRTEYEPMTTERGVTQDKNFANWATRAGNPAATRTPVGIGEDPNIYVAQACAKDPSFRILFVSGTSDGKTLTVGPHYTVWGCSFGNMPPAKRPAPPVNSPAQNQTLSYPSNYNVAVWTGQPFFIVDANTLSWSDNAVVVTFSPRAANHSGPSTAGLVLPAQVLVTRGDGQTRIYGSEGGVYFRPVN